MEKSIDPTTDVPTQVKDATLVSRRRRQIVDAAVRLFFKKGFHKTTTREIAGAAGFSVGSLYEYVASKEDVLFLVCDAIHSEMELAVAKALARTPDAQLVLSGMIREYFLVCDRMRRHILLIYQETASLPSQWREKVMEKELRITRLFVNALERLQSRGDIPPMDINLTAHNIVALGHMWALRGWSLARQYTIEDYIRMQTAMILDGLAVEFVNGERKKA